MIPGFGRTGFGRDEIYPVSCINLELLRVQLLGSLAPTGSGNFLDPN